MIAIWPPPTASQVWPLRGFCGLYATLNQLNAGMLRMLTVSHGTDEVYGFPLSPPYTKISYVPLVEAAPAVQIL